MWSKRLLLFCLAIGIGLWDACIASWLPGYGVAVQVGLVFTVMLAIFSSPERWVVGAIVSGGVADLFLPSNAGFLPLRFLLVGLVIFYLSQRLLTNRSLTSVVLLSGGAVVVDRALSWIFEEFQTWIGRSVTFEAHAPLLFSLLWSCTVGAVVFSIFVLFSKRFLPLIAIGRASRRIGRVRL